jgi:hypothetical protein
MKKLVILLAAALFSLVTAVPANAAPAGGSLEIVPATKVVKAQEHKKVKRAKRKHVRAHKQHR